jgi:hypothetical protein
VDEGDIVGSYVNLENFQIRHVVGDPTSRETWDFENFRKTHVYLKNLEIRLVDEDLTNREMWDLQRLLDRLT